MTENATTPEAEAVKGYMRDRTSFIAYQLDCVSPTKTKQLQDKIDWIDGQVRKVVHALNPAYICSPKQSSKDTEQAYRNRERRTFSIKDLSPPGLLILPEKGSVIQTVEHDEGDGGFCHTWIIDSSRKLPNGLIEVSAHPYLDQEESKC